MEGSTTFKALEALLNRAQELRLFQATRTADQVSRKVMAVETKNTRSAKTAEICAAVAAAKCDAYYNLGSIIRTALEEERGRPEAPAPEAAIIAEIAAKVGNVVAEFEGQARRKRAAASGGTRSRISRAVSLRNEAGILEYAASRLRHISGDIGKAADSARAAWEKEVE